MISCILFLAETSCKVNHVIQTTTEVVKNHLTLHSVKLQLVLLSNWTGQWMQAQPIFAAQGTWLAVTLVTECPLPAVTNMPQVSAEPTATHTFMPARLEESSLPALPFLWATGHLCSFWHKLQTRCSSSETSCTNFCNEISEICTADNIVNFDQT